MSVLEKIKDIEAEVRRPGCHCVRALTAQLETPLHTVRHIGTQMARTQKNKATSGHLGILKARKSIAACMCSSPMHILLAHRPCLASQNCTQPFDCRPSWPSCDESFWSPVLAVAVPPVQVLTCRKVGSGWADLLQAGADHDVTQVRVNRLFSQALMTVQSCARSG